MILEWVFPATLYSDLPANLQKDSQLQVCLRCHLKNCRWHFLLQTITPVIIIHRERLLNVRPSVEEGGLLAALRESAACPAAYSSGLRFGDASKA
jgi:hypothetical protein